MEKDDLVFGNNPRVFVTQPDNPEEEGLTFVWARTRWYQRMEGKWGSVAFSPVTDSEEELRQRLSQAGQPELTEVDDDYTRQVTEEFLEQEPLYPEAPELSNQPLFEEGGPEEQP